MTEQELLAREGDPISAENKWNPLVRKVFSRRIRGGRGVLIREGPDGTIVQYRSRGGVASVSHPFQATAFSAEDESYELTFLNGTVAGLPVYIGKLRMDDEKASLPVKDSQFGADDWCLIFAKLTLTPAWAAKSAELIALPAPPPAQAWIGHKVIARLHRDGTVLQAAFFNVGHATGARRANGFARHYWFIA